MDNPMLEFLDEFESHPDFYFRETAQVLMSEGPDKETIDPPKPVDCGIYFLPKFKPSMLDLKPLENYDSGSGDHGAYVERYKRTTGKSPKDEVVPN